MPSFPCTLTLRNVLHVLRMRYAFRKYSLFLVNKHFVAIFGAILQKKTNTTSSESSIGKERTGPRQYWGGNHHVEFFWGKLRGKSAPIVLIPNEWRFESFFAAYRTLRPENLKKKSTNVTNFATPFVPGESRKKQPAKLTLCTTFSQTSSDFLREIYFSAPARDQRYEQLSKVAETCPERACNFSILPTTRFRCVWKSKRR